MAFVNLLYYLGTLQFLFMFLSCPSLPPLARDTLSHVCAREPPQIKLPFSKFNNPRERHTPHQQQNNIGNQRDNGEGPGRYSMIDKDAAQSENHWPGGEP